MKTNTIHTDRHKEQADDGAGAGAGGILGLNTQTRKWERGRGVGDKYRELYDPQHMLGQQLIRSACRPSRRNTCLVWTGGQQIKRDFSERAMCVKHNRTHNTTASPLLNVSGSVFWRFRWLQATEQTTAAVTPPLLCLLYWPRRDSTYAI